jgi:hypothetical protein
MHWPIYPHGKDPGTHYLENWVDPTPRLNGMAIKKNSEHHTNYFKLHKKNKCYMRSEASATFEMNSSVFWVITQHKMV